MEVGRNSEPPVPTPISLKWTLALGAMPSYSLAPFGDPATASPRIVLTTCVPWPFPSTSSPQRALYR